MLIETLLQQAKPCGGFFRPFVHLILTVDGMPKKVLSKFGPEFPNSKLKYYNSNGVELGLKLRKRRKSKYGIPSGAQAKWHADATYLCIKGHWYYLYRAIDKEGYFVDVYLSDKRDQAVAEAFFKQTEKTTGITPE